MWIIGPRKYIISNLPIADSYWTETWATISSEEYFDGEYRYVILVQNISPYI